MIIVPIIALHRQSDHTILLSVRQQGKDLAGFYEFPGGKTESDELPIEALCREIKEELNIDITPDHLTAISFTEFRHNHTEFLLLLYYCHQYSGVPIGNEGQDILFVPLSQLHTYKMPPANIKLIPTLLKYIDQL